jgi:hypothetical protein
VLRNSELAELLAVEAESAAHPAQRALRRASRRAFLWEVEAAQLLQKGRSLTELSGVGPYIEKKILTWLDHPPSIPETPPIRRGFLALTDARREIDEKPGWLESIRGDLQMHTTWSDGSGSIAEMADVASERHYEYVAITDHSKGLKIAGGIDEIQLQRQAVEIEAINATRSEGSRKTAVVAIDRIEPESVGAGRYGPRQPAKARSGSRMLSFVTPKKGRSDRPISRSASQSEHSHPRPPSGQNL